jgi:hypothetical protein
MPKTLLKNVLTMRGSGFERISAPIKTRCSWISAAIMTGLRTGASSWLKNHFTLGLGMSWESDRSLGDVSGNERVAEFEEENMSWITRTPKES